MPLGGTRRGRSPQVTYHHRVRADDKALSASRDINDSTQPKREDERAQGGGGGGGMIGGGKGLIHFIQQNHVTCGLQQDFGFPLKWLLQDKLRISNIFGEFFQKKKTSRKALGKLKNCVTYLFCKQRTFLNRVSQTIHI